MSTLQPAQIMFSPPGRTWQSIIRAGVAIVVLSFLTTALQSGQSKASPLDAAREAGRAAVQGLRSGHGTGTYEFYEQNPERAKPTLMQTAKFETWFAEGKYHVRLDFAKGPYNNLERQIIIYDRSAFFSSKFFQKDIPHPTGSEGYVNTADVKSTKPHVVLGFPWDMSQLARHCLDLDILLKQPPPTIKIVPVKDKGYRATYRVGEWTSATFEIEPASGFNIVLFSVQNDGEEGPVQHYEATWKKAGDLWYVDSAVEQRDFRRAEIPFRRWFMKYETFEPNCEVPPKYFNLDALELRPGSRILDQRPEAQEPEYYTPGKKTEAAKLDMLLHIQDLPTSRVGKKDHPNNLRNVLLWFGGASSLLLIGVGALSLRKRLSRSDQDGAASKPEADGLG